MLLLADNSVWSCGVNDEGALGRETDGPPWEEAPIRTGSPGDAYEPGRVEIPAGHIA